MFIFASNNTVGGTIAAARNVISGNSYGVGILGANGTRVAGNYIGTDASGTKDLGNDGPTANDPGDADTGPNNLQNKPAISLATTSSTGATTIKGSLISTPSKTFVVRLFSNDSGTNEGKTFIGTKSVNTDASGKAAFTFAPAVGVPTSETVTAIASDPEGNTSEFSAARTVVAS